MRTSTGFWDVIYNTENRPIRFTSENGQTTVECGYDYQGRRHTKKVTMNGSVTQHERYLYNGYLQLAALDMLNGGNPRHFLLWDPLSNRATRALALIQNGQVYSCIHDQGKNVTELLDSIGTIVTTYDYTPYGAVTAVGTVNSPVQWSSEVYDAELGLIYYNYRHYNPQDGRWINRDPLGEQSDPHLYLFAGNSLQVDYLGLSSTSLFDCFPVDPLILTPEEQERQKQSQKEIEEAQKKAEKEKEEEIEKGKTIPPSKESEPEKEYPFLTGTGTIDINKSSGDDPSMIYKLNLKIQLDKNNSVTIDKSSERNQEGAHPKTTSVTAEGEIGDGNTWKVQVTDGPTGVIASGEVNIPITGEIRVFAKGTIPIGGSKSPATGDIGVKIDL